MEQPRILVVEDEEAIARFLALELGHEGYAVTTLGDGGEGLMAALHDGPWAFVLLDVMLPGLSGVEICRRMRQESDVPVLMITARDAIEDRVAGLDAGADDYLTKPFSIEELLARLRAVQRRKGGSGRQEESLALADLRMTPTTREAWRGERKLTLTKREYDLLEHLLRNARVVLSREGILERLWGPDTSGDTNVVDVYVRYLRSKVDDPEPVKLIHTVRGVGYVLREE